MPSGYPLKMSMGNTCSPRADMTLSNFLNTTIFNYGKRLICVNNIAATSMLEMI
jgi:hypothetical protein